MVKFFIMIDKMIDKIADKIVDAMFKLRDTSFYKKYSLIITVMIIIMLIISIIYDVDDCLINKGQPVKMGYKGGLLLLFMIYLGLKLTNKFGLLPFPIIITFLFWWGWSYMYKNYSKGRYKDIMKEKNIVCGTVCEKRINMGQGYHHNLITISHVDNNVKYLSTVSETSNTFNTIHVGDQIVITCSRKYPRVAEVLKWNPSKEEIERYKTPRKFKSYINGKIYEEEE